MAVSPVTPEEFCAAVPLATDPVCIAFQKVFFELPTLICRFNEWAIPIIEGGVGPGDTGLAAPTNLTATQNRTTDIRLSWSPVSGATYYEIWRGSTDVTSEMTLIVANNDAVVTYDDTGAPINTITWYAVKARNPTQVSAFSNAASGLRPEEEVPDVPPPINHGNPTPLTVIVPAGVTSMELWVWGGGGRGGAIPPFSIPGSGGNPYGGGGASGSFIRITGIAVTEGDTYILLPGAGDNASYVYEDEVGNPAYVMATPGGPGGQVFGGTGAGGAPAADAGENTMATGVEDAVNTRVGNAGEAGSVGVVGTGGAGVTYSGVTEAPGQNGINTGGANGNPAGTAQYGYIRLIWVA